MSNPLVTDLAARYMDETADWAVQNVARFTPAELPPSIAPKQSIEHYRHADKIAAVPAKHQALLTRIKALTAETDLMLDDQWDAYAMEILGKDGYRSNRECSADVSACLACWETWDASGHTLYQALPHRIEGLQAEAKWLITQKDVV